MSLAKGRVSGSITKYSVCIRPRKPVPRRSVAGSVPAENLFKIRKEKKNYITRKQRANLIILVWLVWKAGQTWYLWGSFNHWHCDMFNNCKTRCRPTSTSKTFAAFNSFKRYGESYVCCNDDEDYLMRNVRVSPDVLPWKPMFSQWAP